MWASSPWNWEDVISLGQQPRKCRLANSHALRGSDFFEGSNKLHVLGEVLPRVSRVETPNITLLEIVGPLDAAAQQAAGQRGVGDDSHAELTACGEELVLGGLDLGAEGAVLHLHARNRVNGVGAPQSC